MGWVRVMRRERRIRKDRDWSQSAEHMRTVLRKQYELVQTVVFCKNDSSQATVKMVRLGQEAWSHVSLLIDVSRIRTKIGKLH